LVFRRELSVSEILKEGKAVLDRCGGDSCVGAERGKARRCILDAVAFRLLYCIVQGDGVSGHFLTDKIQGKLPEESIFGGDGKMGAGGQSREKDGKQKDKGSTLFSHRTPPGTGGAFYL